MLPTVSQSFAPVLSQSLSAEMCERFLSFADVRPSSLKTYTRSLMQFFNWMKENGVTRPTRADILAYRDELKLRLKPTTVQNYLAALRVFFSWAEVEGLYPNIVKKVKGAQISHEHKKDALVASQVKAVLNQFDRSTVQGARDYAVFALMVTCGLRTVEVERAQVSDLTVRGGRVVILVQGKGRDEKEEVNMPAPVEAAIRAYWVKAGIKSGPMFQSLSNRSRGEAVTTRALRRIVKEAMRAAGYDSEYLTAHSLRHTAVSTAIENGMTVKDAQQFARHMNINTTMIYFHERDKRGNQCAFVNADAFF